MYSLQKRIPDTKPHMYFAWSDMKQKYEKLNIFSVLDKIEDNKNTQKGNIKHT